MNDSSIRQPKPRERRDRERERVKRNVLIRRGKRGTKKIETDIYIYMYERKINERRYLLSILVSDGFLGFLLHVLHHGVGQRVAVLV